MKTSVYIKERKDEIRFGATIGLSFLATNTLLVEAVRSSEEGSVINKMLFNDLTAHLLMPSMWVLKAPSVDHLKALSNSFKINLSRSFAV